jgi:hypothetical protein
MYCCAFQHQHSLLKFRLMLKNFQFSEELYIWEYVVVIKLIIGVAIF